jgi:hypothetical protein
VGGWGWGEQARGAGCYLLRWRWTNSPLALPSKYPIPADVSIAHPTCLIAGRDGAPLGKKETRGHRSSLAYQRRMSCCKRGFVGCTQSTPSFTKCVHGDRANQFSSRSPSPYLCPKFYAFTCYCKVSNAKRCELKTVMEVNELPDSSNRSAPRNHLRCTGITRTCASRAHSTKGGGRLRALMGWAG